MSDNIPVVRDLDGIYNRVRRGDRYVDRCFTDLTEEEQHTFLDQLSTEGLKRMALQLAQTLRHVGDELNIICSDDETEENNDG